MQSHYIIYIPYSNTIYNLYYYRYHDWYYDHGYYYNNLIIMNILYYYGDMKKKKRKGKAGGGFRDLRDFILASVSGALATRRSQPFKRGEQKNCDSYWIGSGGFTFFLIF